MFKKTLACAALACAFAGGASAADVTLYGVVDTGFAYNYTKVDGEKADHQFGMMTGYNNVSRFGLKGTEDLGNGWSVRFILENGFNSDDGTLGNDGRLFGRESALTLAGPYGEFAFGRMGGLASSFGTYDVVYGIADSFWGGDNAILGLGISTRFDNMITYQSPKVAGFQATLQHSFDNDSKADYDPIHEGKDHGDEGSQHVERYSAAAISADFGALKLVGAYELTKWAHNDYSGKFDDQHAFYVGGNYDFGATKVFAMAQYYMGARKFGSTGLTMHDAAYDLGYDDIQALRGFNKGIDFYGLHLGNVTPIAGGDLYAAVYYVDGETSDIRRGGDRLGKVDLRYWALDARYVYPLSKRTSVYGGAGYGEEKADYADGYERENFKRKIGQAYVGVTHKF